jgi:hypothetical protein
MVLMACVIVAAKPLSIDRGSISLSKLRVLGHEIAVGNAHSLQVRVRCVDPLAGVRGSVARARDRRPQWRSGFASPDLRIRVHARRCAAVLQ